MFKRGGELPKATKAGVIADYDSTPWLTSWTLSQSHSFLFPLLLSIVQFTWYKTLCLREYYCYIWSWLRIWYLNDFSYFASFKECCLVLTKEKICLKINIESMCVWLWIDMTMYLSNWWYMGNSMKKVTYKQSMTNPPLEKPYLVVQKGTWLFLISSLQLSEQYFDFEKFK